MSRIPQPPFQKPPAQSPPQPRPLPGQGFLPSQENEEPPVESRITAFISGPDEESLQVEQDEFDAENLGTTKNIKGLLDIIPVDNDYEEFDEEDLEDAEDWEEEIDD